jgi:hypothetical protein
MSPPGPGREGARFKNMAAFAAVRVARQSSAWAAFIAPWIARTRRATTRGLYSDFRVIPAR